MEIQPNAPIAVIGAGAMGVGIAQVAAQAGHPVQIIDRDETAIARGRQAFAGAMTVLKQRAGLTPQNATVISERVSWSTDIAAAGSAVLVIEAIVENLAVKRALFEALEQIASPEAILATNTSSLSVARIAGGLAAPHRFLGLHFFNPAPAMKLVEVIDGPATWPEVTGAAFQLMSRWGKRPVKVGDFPGFIVNRVARPYYAEGFLALGEGLSPSDIDHALVAAGGFRMGPLALSDLIGQDVNYAAASSVHDAYRGRARFKPQPAQRTLVDVGMLGRKSGRGVYDYGAAMPAPSLAAPGAVPVEIATSGGQDGPLAPLIAAAQASGLKLASTPPLAADALSVDGVVLALGDGRRLASRPDVDVLIDLARDLGAAPTMVMTARHETAAAAAAGFAQAIGRRALFISDRPGQIVLRTLAQLANAAADAVADGVASAAGVDEAMVYGANHPEGPLAWAERYGRARLAQALSNIAREERDALYEPSPTIAAP